MTLTDWSTDDSLRFTNSTPRLRRRAAEEEATAMKPRTRGLFDGVVLDNETGCWNWTGASADGYGQKYYRGRQHNVHRLAAHLWMGFDLESGLCVLHHCDNRMCLNPKHLFIGTKDDNNQDMCNKGRHWEQRKEHCIHGHRLAGENIYAYPNKKRRCCRECARTRARKWWREKYGKGSWEAER